MAQLPKPNRGLRLLVILILAIAAVLTYAYYTNDNNSISQLIDRESDISNVELSTVPVEVTITKDGFVPATVTVRRGTTIVWTNQDSAVHHVAGNTESSQGYGDVNGFDGADIAKGESYSFTFEDRGTFSYHDVKNKKLQGIIVVTD